MKVSLLVATWLLTASAFAGSSVPNGIRFYFSPHGQTYFRNNLETVLLKNKVDLRKNHWNDISFILEDPLNEANLPKTFEDSKKEKFHELRSRLGSFFFGFPIKTPRLQISLKGSDLPVQFRTMGAAVDPRGPTAYGRKKGVVVLMRLEADAATFTSQQLRIEDLANKDFLGVMGADLLAARLTDGDRRAAKVEIPLLVDTGPKGANIEVLAVKTNLQKTNFDLNFDKLLLPTIAISVNGKDYSFDKVAFENELRGKLPDLTDLVVSAVKSYFEKSGKELLQPTFNDLAKSLNINLDFDLPGSNGLTSDLKIALTPSAAEYTKSNQLGLVFNAEIVDSNTDTGAARFAASPGKASAPKLTEVDPDTYDISLALHPAALNAVIERAWKNGLLKEIEIGKDSSGDPEMVKLPEAPVLSLSGQPASHYANFHARIAYSVKGLGRILFKGPIPIELDMRVRLETNGKNEIEVVLDQINEGTLKVDTRATWLAPIRAQVEKMVRTKLAKVNTDMKSKRTVMIAVPTLSDLIGIPLRLDTVKTDNGNLVLFADIIGD